MIDPTLTITPSGDRFRWVLVDYLGEFSDEADTAELAERGGLAIAETHGLDPETVEVVPSN